jgi:hypothetical protein
MSKTLRECLLDLASLTRLDRILRIGRQATQKAQEESRQMGVPNVYSIDGQLYYELPSGELTTEDPFVSGEMDALQDEQASSSSEAPRE